MSTTMEPETLGELIADCALIPDSLRTEPQAAPGVPAPRPWQVDDACHAQVADAEAYI
ncbi:hypothetical protein [Amycolatopsis nigrescens]|uniref:hypothetical protein n=1 Tax=Amycolatopsis nigrescens TaxID=381445 RepID=UPI0003807F37|nr:hypothetical protein [Amycolatopsis nigrescens]